MCRRPALQRSATLLRSRYRRNRTLATRLPDPGRAEPVRFQASPAPRSPRSVRGGEDPALRPAPTHGARLGLVAWRTAFFFRERSEHPPRRPPASSPLAPWVGVPRPAASLAKHGRADPLPASSHRAGCARARRIVQDRGEADRGGMGRRDAAGAAPPSQRGSDRIGGDPRACGPE